MSDNKVQLRGTAWLHFPVGKAPGPLGPDEWRKLRTFIPEDVERLRSVARSAEALHDENGEYEDWLIYWWATSLADRLEAAMAGKRQVRVRERSIFCKQCGVQIDHQVLNTESFTHRIAGVAMALLAGDALKAHRAGSECPAQQGWYANQWEGGGFGSLNSPSDRARHRAGIEGIP